MNLHKKQFISYCILYILIVRCRICLVKKCEISSDNKHLLIWMKNFFTHNNNHHKINKEKNEYLMNKDENFDGRRIFYKVSFTFSELPCIHYLVQ